MHFNWKADLMGCNGFYYFNIFSVFLTLSISNVACAVEISFTPRLETGIIHYTFESEGSGATLLSLPSHLNTGYNISIPDFKFSDILPYTGVGGTFFYNRFFLDVSGQYAFNGKDRTTIIGSTYHISSIEEDFSYVNTQFTAMEQEYTANFDRREMAISLGYALTSNCSVFVGYKWTATEFDTMWHGRMTGVYYQSDPDLDGKAGFDIWGNAQFRFKYGGPFIGGIQGWSFSRYRFFNGTLTGSLALAYLTGKVEMQDTSAYLALTMLNDQPFAGEPDSVEGDHLSPRLDAKGETLGLTVGIGWRGETAVDGLTYHLGINAYRYEFDTQYDAPDASEPNINETAFLYKLGLSYSF